MDQLIAAATKEKTEEKAKEDNFTAVTIDSTFIQRGIRFNVNGKNLDLTYPGDIWLQYPQFYKKILLENLTFALTFHLPYLRNVKSLEYHMARPLVEPFIFKAFTLSLPSTALMKSKEKQTTSNLLKKFFDVEYNFNRERNILVSNLSPRETNKTVLLPFTFGKDSLLTYSLCDELGIKAVLVFIKEPLLDQESVHKERLARLFLDEFKQDVLMVDNQTGLLREANEGWYGWELQLTQYALMFLPLVHAHKARYVFFSNEQSCNDEFIDGEGFKCNPVYEQGYRWLQQIDDLVQILGVKNLEVGSIIEPLHEIAIIKILHHRYPKIAKYQTSCFEEKPEAKNNPWCGWCSKCARNYIFLLAHNIDPAKVGIPNNMLELKYKDKYSLFENGNSKDSGYDQSRLNRDEQLLAFLMAYRNGYRGPLIDLFSSLYLEEAIRREKELRKKFFGLHTTVTIPKELKDRLMKIYQEELINLT